MLDHGTTYLIGVQIPRGRDSFLCLSLRMWIVINRVSWVLSINATTTKSSSSPRKEVHKFIVYLFCQRLIIVAFI